MCRPAARRGFLVDSVGRSAAVRVPKMGYPGAASVGGTPTRAASHPGGNQASRQRIQGEEFRLQSHAVMCRRCNRSKTPTKDRSKRAGEYEDEPSPDQAGALTTIRWLGVGGVDGHVSVPSGRRTVPVPGEGPRESVFFVAFNRSTRRRLLLIFSQMSYHQRGEVCHSVLFASFSSTYATSKANLVPPAPCRECWSVRVEQSTRFRTPWAGSSGWRGHP